MPKTQATARGKATSVGRPNCHGVGKETRPPITPGLLSSTRHGTFLALWTASLRQRPRSLHQVANTTPTFSAVGRLQDIMCTSQMSLFSGIEAQSTSGH